MGKKTVSADFVLIVPLEVNFIDRETYKMLSFGIE
jgi:hypothetical protein